MSGISLATTCTLLTVARGAADFAVCAHGLPVLALTVSAMTYSIMTLDPSAAVEVVYDGSVYAAPLHLLSAGAAVCGSPVANAVTFTSTPASVVDIVCVHCERALRARVVTPPAL